MLNRLHIQDLAIVRSQAIEYEPGLTVLTGETGAGKSLLLDGLGLIMGQRADSSLVNSQSKRAEVIAEFDLQRLANAHQWLCAHDLDDADDPYALSVRRSVTQDGRSKAYINNRPVTLQDLRALSEHLISLQGQHAAYALLQPERQRTLVDQYGHHRELKGAVRTAWQQHQTNQLALKTLLGTLADADAQRALLEYQVEELDKLAPESGEWARLEVNLTLLGSADERTATYQSTQFELSEGENSPLAITQRLAKRLASFGSGDTHAAGAHSLLSEAAINLEEALRELDSACDNIESDPEALRRTETRIAEWMELSRKHRVEPATLDQLHGQLQHKLSQMSADRSRLPDIENAVVASEQALKMACAALTDARIASAETLMATVNAQLKELELKDAVLAYELTPKKPSAEGAEDIHFTLTANSGQKAQALSKVASGGELSRIALAIQVCVASQLETPTLIFDEVDVGIGGRTAAKVGELLRKLAVTAQVFVVTHQPQVAAAGQTHLHVSKHKDDQGMRSHVQTLTPPQRVDEIARMLGGLDVTKATKTTAQELLMGA
ncbi:DNA repair protein RecN [Litorivicinus lipolyticus]|uniref:DNA repair protein RecN n=1 Tax=Litorivicinus lipolyticus TaxID=418701 RepID=A0A5Q2Q5U5_9GAMM|nr:DNA repair protein RecN [Litorivicinus lipolyticus]QGG79459.1 DNA repair protein RecN [Litorivicinus lipolyticus]